jgi:transposase
MDIREQRGLIIAARCRLTQDQGQWHVPSQTAPGKTYLVDLGRKSCTCTDHLNGSKCKHIYAVEFTLGREVQASARAAIETNDMSFVEKPTYRQNWPAYNQAQVTEKHRFQVLLFELCKHAEPFTRKLGRGRERIPAANVLFAAIFKVYSTFSARRFACDLRDAFDRGYITRPLHYNAICASLEKDEVTVRLTHLLRVSSLPLKAVEVDFAADSTGFSTNRFARWFDERQGINRSVHDWVKVHIMCGVKTNIITSAKVENRHGADAPQFKPLLATTAEEFKIREVSADKAYLSIDNIEAVFDVGGTPYIPFKTNSLAGSGGLFEKAFHYYSLHREEFLQHYHKRSNVESTFSAIKRKFGNNVRSRTDTSMVNEVLCKLVCHNISCLIHSQHELGIDPVFWKDETLSGKE